MKLARRLFVSLERWNPRHEGHYLVLNDGYYVTDFYAENDSKAIEIFENTNYGC